MVNREAHDYDPETDPASMDFHEARAMKASEVIALLANTISKHGDLPVLFYTEPHAEIQPDPDYKVLPVRDVGVFHEELTNVVVLAPVTMEEDTDHEFDYASTPPRYILVNEDEP